VECVGSSREHHDIDSQANGDGRRSQGEGDIYVNTSDAALWLGYRRLGVSSLSSGRPRITIGADAPWRGQHRFLYSFALPTADYP
jgi:hypothetical protein